jgi:HSP20 family protein
MSMSWRYGKKKTDEDSDYPMPFGFGLLSSLDIDEMFEQMTERMNSLAKSTAGNPNTLFYGYQVTVGPDGKPHVKEFGNAKEFGNLKFPFGNVEAPTKVTPELGSREPLIDVVPDEKDGIIKVVVEMPGIRKEDIQLNATEDSLTIKAERGERKFNTTVPLDSQVDPSSTKASYNNGVLEVKLKSKSTKPKTVNVKVD